MFRFPLANGVQRWERGQVVEFQVCRNPILKDDPETQFLACNIDILVDGRSSQSLPAGGAGGGDQLRGFSQTQPPDPSYSSGTAQPFDVSFKERQSFKTADSYPTSTYLEGAATVMERALLLFWYQLQKQEQREGPCLR